MRYKLDDWPNLISHGDHVFVLEAAISERDIILSQLQQWCAPQALDLQYWNPGYRALQTVARQNGMTSLESSHLILDPQNPVQCLLDQVQAGVIVLDGLLETESPWNTLSLAYQVLNAAFEFQRRQRPCYWIFLGEILDLNAKLDSLIPQLYLPLPNAEQIIEIIQQTLSQTSDAPISEPDIPNLVKASLGLPLGELKSVVERSRSSIIHPKDLVPIIIEHKLAKLRGKGLELISEPDVPVGGLDILDEQLNRASALLSPNAKTYGLDFPKGLILWGPPGTGKSLSAKHAAKKMGVPLIAADWGGLISNVPGESEANLRFLLELVEISSPCVLYWDDFDKAFAGWNSDAGSGVQRRLSGKLLTWMQERTAPVFVIATVNRLEMLPPELNRRFDDIFFVDLPHAGARKAIFDIHLAKYAPAFGGEDGQTSPLSIQDWHLLLREYNLCSAAEIANAVRKAAEESFYNNRPGVITFDDLMKQRTLFTPAMIREEEQILAIRKRATFARPASSPDQSQWQVPPSEMFEFLRQK